MYLADTTAHQNSLSSFVQTVDAMRLLRCIAYFASDFLTNPNPLREFGNKNDIAVLKASWYYPADLKRFSRRESREISVVALARLFERSEFRSQAVRD